MASLMGLPLRVWGWATLPVQGLVAGFRVAEFVSPKRVNVKFHRVLKGLG